MLPVILLIVAFLLLLDKTRNMIFGAAASVFAMIQGLPPFSQAVVSVLFGAAVLGCLLLSFWPKSTKPHGANAAK